MVVPKSLKDAELLLNDYTALNEGYPIYGELGTDDYYLPDANWEGVTDIDQRNTYIWADQPYRNVIQWQRPYKVVYLANQVIDILSKLDRNNEPEKYNRTLGAAHFYRAFAFQQLLEVFLQHMFPVQPQVKWEYRLDLTQVLMVNQLEHLWKHVINKY